MFRIIVEQTKKMVREPKRWREVLRPRRWRQFFNVLFFSARTGDKWKTAEGEAFKRREYASYEEYVAHQKSKFQYLDLSEYDLKYGRALKERLEKLAWLKPGMKVLCLGARQGTEVKAFRALGCEAIGIDLMPGENNPYVVQGDFHNLQFSEESMDVMFTNSFDHAFDAKKMIGEIRRVLKPGGRLIVEAMQGEQEANTPDAYASFWWQRVEDLAALLNSEGLETEGRATFEEPWTGEQLCLVKR